MISAIVLAATMRERVDLAPDDLDRLREIVVRSLVWLVSAVVSGVVRDVTLATPAGLGLADVADQAGCNLVQAESEAVRLQAALAGCRTDRILIVQAGYEPADRLIEELDFFLRRNSVDAVALIRAAPETLVQRLWPERAPIVGVLAPRTRVSNHETFARMRVAFSRAATLRARAVQII